MPGDSALPVGVELFDDWEAVARDSAGALDAGPCLFGRLGWFRLLAAHCPPPGRLLAARAREGDRAAWLLMAADGRRARAYANWYSLRFGLIGDEALAAPIAAALRGRLSAVELAPLATPEPLAAAFRRAGWFVFVRPAAISWQAATGGSDFAAYWAARPSRLRRSAERKARAAGLDIEIHRRFDPAAWADYEAVYRASWKPAEGSLPFLRALAETEGSAGRLRLGIARLDAGALAAQLWLVEGGIATIHKLAYREESARLSPGTVLGMAMFRAAIDDDRVERIDYGLGDEPYKAEWMDERHMLWRIEAFDPRTPAGLAGAVRAAASSLVRRLRSR